MDIIFLDIEASGLASASYPIEIAWAWPEQDKEDSFLIDPTSADGWEYWDEYAEEIHCIDRNELIEQGVSVEEAAERLHSQLKGRTVISDAQTFDSFWMNRLFDEVSMRPEFKLVGVETVLTPVELEAYKEQSRLQRRYHRALSDVHAMITLFNEVRA
ncbi:MAG: hypothetical protein ACPGMR_09790 [Pontibacterium sp.]